MKISRGKMFSRLLLLTLKRDIITFRVLTPTLPVRCHSTEMFIYVVYRIIQNFFFVWPIRETFWDAGYPEPFVRLIEKLEK